MTHYPTEGAAYAAAREANERQMLVDVERELRNAVESWYYAQKHVSNLVENNRRLREAWEVFQDQARIVEQLPVPAKPVDMLVIKAAFADRIAADLRETGCYGGSPYGPKTWLDDYEKATAPRQPEEA